MALKILQLKSIVTWLGLFRWSMFIMGAASMCVQLAILRELMTLTAGNELILGIGLSLWLLLVGFWSWVGGYLRANPSRLAVLFALAPLFFLASLWFLPFIRAGSHLPGEVGSPGREVFVALMALLPSTAFAGLTYALSVSRCDARQTTATYAAETLGAAIAGAAFHFLLAGFIDSIGLLLIAGALCAVTAIFLFLPEHRFWAVSLPVVLFILASTSVCSIEQRRLQAEVSGEQVVHSAPSRYGRVTVVEREGQRSFFHNGVVLFSTQDREAAEERVHLPLLLHPNPQHVLLVGGCLGGALGEVLRHNPSRVDCVEWDVTLIQFARPYLDAPSTQALADPRVSVIETDGRVHFRNSQGRYDVILIIAPIPKNAFLGRLLSVEALQDARKALGRGGILVVATPGRAAHFDQATLDRHSMLASTLALVFPDTGVSPGGISHFWGANQPIPESVTLLTSRLMQRKIQTMTIGSVWLADRFFPFHLQTYRESLTRSSQKAHFELRPAIFLLGMVEEFNLSLPWLARALTKLSKSPTWLWGFFAAVLGLALILPRMNRSSSSPRFAAFAVGASGMSIEILVMFAFQTMQGHLYYVLGGIFALFMMGLVVGAYWGRWLASTTRGVGWACAFASSVAALSIWSLGLVRTIPATAMLMLSIVAILAGMATAAIYAPAVACVVQQKNATAAGARIYAFDLLGSALAALIASWIMIPILGLTALALVATMLCISAALANLGMCTPMRDK